MRKKTLQNFFTIDSTKYNVKMQHYATKKNGTPTKKSSAMHKPTKQTLMVSLS